MKSEADTFLGSDQYWECLAVRISIGNVDGDAE